MKSEGPASIRRNSLIGQVFGKAGGDHAACRAASYYEKVIAVGIGGRELCGCHIGCLMGQQS